MTKLLESKGLFKYVSKGPRRARINDYLRSQKRHLRCQICGAQPIGSGSRFGLLNLMLDHDHETGFVRDYLCNSCNTGLGAFQDSSDLLEKAALYLRRHREAVALATSDRSGPH